MTIPTVGGSDIGTPVRLAINDSNSADYEFSDANLTSLLVNAMDYYSRFAPYLKEVTITTVNAQSDYTVPSDCVHIVSAPWRPYPGLSQTSFVAFWNLLYGSADILPSKDWRDEVSNKIRMELAARYDNLGKGDWNLFRGYTTSYAPQAYIRLYPAPTRDSDTFTMLFTAKHPLNAAGTNYFTVPAYHFELVRKLLVAEVLETRSFKLDSTPDDYTFGSTRLRTVNSSRDLQQHAERLRDEVRNILSQGIVAHG